MGTRYALARTDRRITFKLETHDVRKYLLTDIVNRIQSAVTRAGGELRGGVYAPPKQIKRWVVNRSPHVNKTSREKFWCITHKRVIKWDANTDVDPEAPIVISRMLPPTVAVRVIEDLPGLMVLKDVFETMKAAKEGPKEKKEESRVHQDSDKFIPDSEDVTSAGAIEENNETKGMDSR